jgi:hypothetical protein
MSTLFVLLRGPAPPPLWVGQGPRAAGAVGAARCWWWCSTAIIDAAGSPLLARFCQPFPRPPSPSQGGEHPSGPVHHPEMVKVDLESLTKMAKVPGSLPGA